MNKWLQIKGTGIEEKTILVLQNNVFYSKSNAIITTISINTYITDLTCNILEGDNIVDARIVETKHISFNHKKSFIAFLNQILFKFITPSIKIDLIIAKRKDGSIIATLTKGESSTGVLIQDKTIQSTPISGNLNNTKEESQSPESVFCENIQLFKDLLEPLYSDRDNREYYVAKWKTVISKIPNGNKLNDEFSNFENDIDLWFGILFSWGLKRDQCKNYKSGSFDINFYDVQPSNTSTSMYEVVSPYWSVVKKENGANKEILIKKGLLRG